METETRELSSVSRGKIKCNTTDDWKNEKLFVPPLPPTNLRGCHLIRIQYDVFVSGQINEKPENDSPFCENVQAVDIPRLQKPNCIHNYFHIEQPQGVELGVDSYKSKRRKKFRVLLCVRQTK